MNRDLERIKQLVLKQLSVCITKQETEELHTLCDGNARYRALVERMLSPQFLAEAALDKSGNHQAHYWNKLRRAAHLHMPLRYTLKRIASQWPHAAAILILVGFAVMGIWRDKAPAARHREASSMEAMVYIDGLDRPETICGVYDFATICQELKRKTGDKITAIGTRFIRLVVPEGKNYKLRLSDGTMIYMKEGSFFSAPTDFSHRNRKVYFTGEARMDIPRTANQQFCVYTGCGDISSPEGQLDINCMDGGHRVEVMVNEGRASVVNAHEAVALGSMHKALIDEDKRITVQTSRCTDPKSRWSADTDAERWMASAPDPQAYIKE